MLLRLMKRLVAPFLAACLSLASAAGLDVRPDAQLSDIGLPAYPGAIPVPDKDLDRPGFSFGLWFASFGVHVYLLSYHSGDDADTVGAFYLKAMAPYGPVLDCSANRAAAPGNGHGAASSPKEVGDDSPVTCDDDTVKPGGHLFKVGRHNDYRLVQIEPRHAGVHLQLVRVEAHGTD